MGATPRSPDPFAASLGASDSMAVRRRLEEARRKRQRAKEAGLHNGRRAAAAAADEYIYCHLTLSSRIPSPCGAAQPCRFLRVGADRAGMEELARPEFAYYYVDHDIASLCAHLEEEHLHPRPICTHCYISFEIGLDSWLSLYKAS